MAIDLNTLPEEEGEKVPDLNKSPAEHEEDHNPLEDVVAVVEVGGADHFGLHPVQNEEQEQIHHQGKHFGLSLSLSPKIGKLVYFTLQKSQATTRNLVTASIFSPKTLV